MTYFLDILSFGALITSCAIMFFFYKYRNQIFCQEIPSLLAQALKREDWPEALQLAARAYRLNPKSEWVIATLHKLELLLKQWEEASGDAAPVASATSARRTPAVVLSTRQRRDYLIRCRLAGSPAPALAGSPA